MAIPAHGPLDGPARRVAGLLAFALAFAVSGALFVAAAQASGDGERERDRGRVGDHERARAAVQAGEVLPLAVLLQRLQRTHPGQVLEVELERDDGRWLYELKLLQPGGQLLKLEIDAASGQVLKARSRPSPPRPAASAP